MRASDVQGLEQPSKTVQLIALALQGSQLTVSSCSLIATLQELSLSHVQAHMDLAEG